VRHGLGESRDACSSSRHRDEMERETVMLACRILRSSVLKFSDVFVAKTNVLPMNLRQ
jgi:hypothetical protein